MPAVEYWLECPKCRAKRRLPSYVPHDRHRCRKCRSILEVPGPSTEPDAKPLPAPVRRKLLRIFSIPRLAALASVSTAAAVVLVLWLWSKYLDTQTATVRSDAVTYERVGDWNPDLPMPMIAGLQWILEGTGGTRCVVEVLSSSRPDETQVVFEVRETCPDGTATSRIGLREDGYFLLEERRGDAVWTLDPPLKLMPRDLPPAPGPVTTWDSAGVATDGSGETQEWSLHASAQVETTSTPLRTFYCWAIRRTIRRGNEESAETLWYGAGFGPVRWRRPEGATPPEAWVTRRQAGP